MRSRSSAPEAAISASAEVPGARQPEVSRPRAAPSYPRRPDAMASKLRRARARRTPASGATHATIRSIRLAPLIDLPD